MDVSCANCREPWDSYHMRHDAIYDTDLPHNLAKRASDKGTPLNEIGVRQALEKAGWKFGGSSVLAILNCPCCRRNAENSSEPDPDAEDRAMRRSVLAEVLGDDEDGLQSMLEDLEALGE